MKVTVAAILEKIEKLPDGYPDLVHKKGFGIAEVESFTHPNEVGPYTVSIKPHKDDPGDKTILDVICSCTARTLCKHIVAYYVVAKGLTPHQEVEETLVAESSNGKKKALAMVAEAQQKMSEAFQLLTDGIALYVKES